MMSNDDTKRGSSILNSLKKLIFEDDQPQQTPPVQAPPTPSTNAAPERLHVPPAYSSPTAQAPTGKTPPPIPITANDGTTDLKEMKLKVYAILEKLNEQGVDFFEVWNAAAAMGKVEENTLKAAYTSLKFVDSSLTKDKLVATGTNYANKLKETIAKESEQKQAEKKKTEQDRTMEIANLNTEIKTITENIAKLQDDLQKKQVALEQINEKYEPRIKDIEQKINIGNAAVDEVVTEINTALQMINQSIT
ncbi:hypothetical protein HS960_24145 [Sphingobacterium paramultivorum]|uniref:Uncharacterized protein n=1 Tax=Sphingobacterium paramultivorum TaxID=2886510 RepID=A0A7G5E980_9SPHI|nr:MULTISPECIES: hypothetical protein [Sphingobacterium]MCS4167019.1 esterase/lipase [Sphingobacterium sp. BIGb0116]QMV70555.1 hypothetical protein HS960_24145 [Sphingobacterium paramultivorum]WSO14417.1 hypothetical protein VUL84_24155 [Sphingobacterium paramultivorum]